jgi:TfoX/Sxy family transcriptional regulator of competence genes
VAYDEILAARIRKLAPKAKEKRMFGGIGLMEHGHLVAGVSRDDLIVRVPVDEMPRWLRQPGAHPMMAGRSMSGWVKVSSSSLGDDKVLMRWVERSRALTPSRHAVVTTTSDRSRARSR